MKTLIGKQEWCALPQLGLDCIRAKIDTGAKTSALHAENIKCITRDNVDYVQFTVDNYSDNSKQNSVDAHNKKAFSFNMYHGLTMLIKKYILDRQDAIKNRYELPIKCKRTIKSSNGTKELRYVISTVIHLGDYSTLIDITLTSRENMRFNFLLGISALANNFIIDPSKIYLLPKPGQA
jgi:ribosomal protein S6--L-glutamate ligase